MEGLLILGLAIVAVVVAHALITWVTIYEFQRGVHYRSGRLAGVLPAGRHRLFRPWDTVTLLDTRAQVVTVPNQEVLTADNVAVKCSVAASYRVSDPVKAVTEAVSAHDSLYLGLQLRLRALVGSVPAEELLARRAALSQTLFDAAKPEAEALGLSLAMAGIRDITFPGEIKKVFAQVVQAEKGAQAALAKARGEIATLRALNNAARMVEASPALLTLRTLHSLQDLANSSGNTIVVGMPSPTLPMLVHGEKPAQLPQPPEVEAGAEE